MQTLKRAHTHTLLYFRNFKVDHCDIYPCAFSMRFSCNSRALFSTFRNTLVIFFNEIFDYYWKYQFCASAIIDHEAELGWHRSYLWNVGLTFVWNFDGAILPAADPHVSDSLHSIYLLENYNYQMLIILHIDIRKNLY